LSNNPPSRSNGQMDYWENNRLKYGTHYHLIIVS